MDGWMCVRGSPQKAQPYNFIEHESEKKERKKTKWIFFLNSHRLTVRFVSTREALGCVWLVSIA